MGRAHGLGGDVTIVVRTDEPERRFVPGAVFSTRRGDLTLVVAKWHGRRLLGKFEGAEDRSAAESLQGSGLWVDVSPDERPDDPEEFYDHQLVGLVAEDEHGATLGSVTEVLHLPSQDVLVLRRDGRDVLIPFVSALVPVVDLAGRRVVIIPQPGLLDEHEETAIRTNDGP